MTYASILMTVALVLTATSVAASSNDLLERLRIDHAAMVAVEQDFRSRRQHGSLNGQEATDYAAYVARLHRQVAEDCVAVAGAGLAIPAELNCPIMPPSPTPAAIDQAGEQTTDEQIASLDAELLSGMGEFDEMLLHEQERIRAATPMTDAGGGAGGGAGEGEGAGGGAGGAAGESADGGAEGEDAGSATGGQDTGQGDSSYGAGAGTGVQRQAGKRGAPADIPDGSDDDVVARQLREAAEKETDPELKKKLWEEYRKYKQGLR